MSRGWALVVSVVASAACLGSCSRNHEPRSDEPKAAQERSADQETASRISDARDAGAAPRPTRHDMDIEKKNLSDAWDRAADVVLDASRDWFEQTGVKRVVISPLRSPSGETVPHLLLVETYGPDGALLGRGRSLVVEGELTRGGGPQALAAYLSAQGFPKHRIDRGLLVELVDIFEVVRAEWLILPHAHGWEAMDQADNLIQQRPVELEYGDDNATLRLYRAGQGHGGPEPPPKERLTVRFDRHAKPTLTTETQQEDGAPWQPLQP